MAACHLWERDIVLDFVLAISFSCSSHDLTIIKKNHTFSNSLLVTVVTQFTTKTIYYFLSLMSYLINKLKSHILFTSKKMCVFLLRIQKKIVALKWRAGVLLPALAPVSTTLPKGSTNLLSQSPILLNANASLYSNASQHSGAVKACKKFTPR